MTSIHPLSLFPVPVSICSISLCYSLRVGDFWVPTLLSIWLLDTYRPYRRVQKVRPHVFYIYIYVLTTAIAGPRHVSRHQEEGLPLLSASSPPFASISTPPFRHHPFWRQEERNCASSSCFPSFETKRRGNPLIHPRSPPLWHQESRRRDCPPLHLCTSVSKFSTAWQPPPFFSAVTAQGGAKPSSLSFLSTRSPPFASVLTPGGGRPLCFDARRRATAPPLVCPPLHLFAPFWKPPPFSFRRWRHEEGLTPSSLSFSFWWQPLLPSLFSYVVV